MKNATSFDLIIPEEVEAKIRHLCSKVHDVEWSGTLFYTVEGSLDDGTFKATCVDICVMDIGTTGYTEFKDTEDIISYRLNHRDTLLREGVYEALIHSHNNMKAFFSGTDLNTLLSEGSDLNHFLSLIVCNAGQYVARITRKLKTRTKAEAHIVYTKTVEYNSYEDRRIVITDGETSETDKTEEREETIIEYFELNINKAQVEEPFKELDDRLDEIKRGKYTYRPTTPYTYHPGIGGYQPPVFNAQGEPYSSAETPAKEKSGKSNQLSMFGHEEVEYPSRPAIPVRTPQDDDFVEFYTVEKVPFQILKTLCTQLLLGSILATQQSNINLNNWVEKMDKVYAKRFGNLDNPDSYEVLRLKTWIDQMIENIIGYSVDKDYEDKVAAKYGLDDDYEYEDSDAFIHLYACDMITFLEDLPNSKVKDMMIESLIKQMPHDYIH